MIAPRSKNRGKTNHKIFTVDYHKTEENPDGILECVCGWIGRAYDRIDLAGDVMDYPHHKKTAEPIDITMDKYAASTHAMGIKKKVLVESY